MSEVTIPVFTETPVEAVNTVPVEKVEEKPVVSTDETGEVKPEVKLEEGKDPEKDPVKDAEQEEKQGKRRYERRLDKAYKAAAEQKARADFLEKQMSESRPAPVQDAGEPKIENYSDIEEYATDKAKYQFERMTKDSDAKRQQETNVSQYNKLVSSWEEKVDKIDKKYPDWDEKVGDVKPNSPMMYAIFEAENGEDIAHWLGSDTKEAARIMALPPASQIREIGKLEAKLAATPVVSRGVSKAPAPITPLGGSNTGSDKKMSDMNYDEFTKRREKYISTRR